MNEIKNFIVNKLCFGTHCDLPVYYAIMVYETIIFDFWAAQDVIEAI